MRFRGQFLILTGLAALLIQAGARADDYRANSVYFTYDGISTHDDGSCGRFQVILDQLSTDEAHFDAQCIRHWAGIFGSNTTELQLTVSTNDPLNVANQAVTFDFGLRQIGNPHRSGCEPVADLLNSISNENIGFHAECNTVHDAVLSGYQVLNVGLSANVVSAELN